MRNLINASNYSIDSLVWLANEKRKGRGNKVSIDQVFEEVCNILKESPEMVKSKSRQRNYLFCRYITAYVSYTVIHATLDEIGRFLGSRDHTSILTGNKKVRVWIKDKEPIFYKSWKTYIDNSEIWKQDSPK